MPSAAPASISPNLDARVLIGHALSLDHAGLVASSANADAVTAAGRTRSTRSRRAASRASRWRALSAQGVLGPAPRASPSTLVPRPETETVVEAALAAIDDPDRARGLRIADLGTGTGALLLALLTELPHATGIGIDISACRGHGRRGERAAYRRCGSRCLRGRELDRAARSAVRPVVSNPPYIATAAISSLAPEVRDHEPHAAPRWRARRPRVLSPPRRRSGALSQAGRSPRGGDRGGTESRRDPRLRGPRLGARPTGAGRPCGHCPGARMATAVTDPLSLARRKKPLGLSRETDYLPGQNRPMLFHPSPTSPDLTRSAWLAMSGRAIPRSERRSSPSKGKAVRRAGRDTFIRGVTARAPRRA